MSDTSEIEIEYEDTEGILGLIASAFFFVGLTALVWGDNAQTSLKTVVLLGISEIVAVPLGGSIGYIFWYSVFGVLWLWIIYQVTCQSEEKSRMKKTYQKKIDAFPHWLGCLLPSVAATFCTYLLVDKARGLGQCRIHFAENVLGCTHIFLQLLKANIAALAFIPQVYVILYHVWGYEGAKLHLKVKVFMGCMFVCYSLWMAMWIWRNSELVLDPSTWDSSAASQIFLFFVVAHAVTLCVIAAPWIYRATCLKCCGTCTPSRSGRPEDGPPNDPGEVALGVNTGGDNFDEDAAKKEDAKKAWPWSSAGGKNNDVEEPQVDATTPAIIGGSSVFGYSSGTPVSSQHNNNNNNNNNDDDNQQQQQYHTTDDNTPDWLQ